MGIRGLAHRGSLLNMSRPIVSLAPRSLNFTRRHFVQKQFVEESCLRRVAALQPCRLRTRQFKRQLVTQQVGPQMPSPSNEADGSESEKKESEKSVRGSTLFKMAEAALTTFASVAILGFVQERNGGKRFCANPF